MSGRDHLGSSPPVPEALAVPTLAVGRNAAKTYLALLIVTVQTFPDTVVHRDRGGKERRGDEGARGDGEHREGVAPRR